MQFLLGTHEPYWLARAGVPLFVSHRRLIRLRARTLPRAAAPWALDSGGFTELQKYGGWRTTPTEYADWVQRYAAEVGQLQWCAPQDWMCEPEMIAGTGRSVREHQELTVASYLALRDDHGLAPWVVPVLQGYQVAEYLACADLYASAGVDLAAQPLVGLGSVCRRQAQGAAHVIVRELAGAGYALHGFGVKITGLRMYADALASADSMAWSYDARRGTPMAGCTHARCNNCLRYALAWRRRTVAAVHGQGYVQLPMEVGT